MRYKNQITGKVVELEASYASVFGDLFVEVDDNAPVYVEPCCGGSDGDDNYDDESEDIDA